MKVAEESANAGEWNPLCIVVPNSNSVFTVCAAWIMLPYVLMCYMAIGEHLVRGELTLSPVKENIWMLYESAFISFPSETHKLSWSLDNLETQKTVSAGGHQNLHLLPSLSQHRIRLMLDAIGCSPSYIVIAQWTITICLPLSHRYMVKNCTIQLLLSLCTMYNSVSCCTLHAVK